MAAVISIIVISILAYGVMRFKQIKVDKRAILIALVLEVIGAAFCISEVINEKNGFEGVLERNPAGEGDYEKELTAKLGDASYDVSIDVGQQAVSRDEAYTYIDSAISEIEESFLKDNPGIEAVSGTVEMRDSYASGMVEADWTLDSHGVMSPDGTLRLDKLKEPTEVTACAVLTCGEVSSPYEITFTVVPPSIQTEEGFRYALSKYLEKENEEKKYSSTLEIPDELGGQRIEWSELRSHTGEEIAIFGFVIFFVLIFAEREEVRRAKLKRQQELSRDYPDIVGRLSLFVGAGITPKSAFERMGKWYEGYLDENGSKERPGFEAVLKMNRRIADGAGEIEGYKLLGEDTHHKDFRKLSLMLTQNLRKGSRDLIEQLEKEERNAYEDRKQKARIAGEEASTKLLIPMLMMLSVLLVVLILPSIWGMGI